jgi:hypothetical protein
LIHGAVELPLQRAFVAHDFFEHVATGQCGHGAAHGVFGIHLLLTHVEEFVEFRNLRIQILEDLLDMPGARFLRRQVFGVEFEMRAKYFQFADNSIWRLPLAALKLVKFLAAYLAGVFHGAA